MSRGAAALAYSPPWALDADDEEPSSGPHRLLGDRHTQAGPWAGRIYTTPAQRQFTGLHPALLEPEEPEVSGLVPIPYLDDVALESIPPQPARITLSNRSKIVAAGALLALLLVGLPFFIHLRLPVGARGLSLSGYADLGAATQASGPVPVIDTTTQQAAPAQAQPAPPQQAPPAPPPGSYELQAPPSISVARIDQVLSDYGSPAAGMGQALYDLGVKYGIDPAYALAFFVHESGCGTKGVARFTKSLGNIRWSEGYGNYQGYRSYETWQQGMEDWYQLIKDLYIGGWGLHTVDTIVPVYAPAADSNDPGAYVAAVKEMVDSWRGK